MKGKEETHMYHISRESLQQKKDGLLQLFSLDSLLCCRVQHKNENQWECNVSLVKDLQYELEIWIDK